LRLVERYDVEEFKLGAAAALEPVAKASRYEDSLVRTDLAEDLVALAIETRAAANDHPQTILMGMRVEVVLTALLEHMNQCVHAVRIGKPDDLGNPV
jgi:hypothetical protein